MLNDMFQKNCFQKYLSFILSSWICGSFFYALLNFYAFSLAQLAL